VGVEKRAFGGIALGGGEPLFPAAIRYGNLLLLSGQAPIDPETMTLVATDFSGQAEFVMSAITQTLETAGGALSDVLRVECILSTAADFGVWNEIFARTFPAPRPARTTFVGSFVVPGMLLEVQVTAGV
jgi:2-iminobutanoate/2-iminopropanoate deaminase